MSTRIDAIYAQGQLEAAIANIYEIRRTGEIGRRLRHAADQLGRAYDAMQRIVATACAESAAEAADRPSAN